MERRQVCGRASSRRRALRHAHLADDRRGHIGARAGCFCYSRGGRQLRPGPALVAGYQLIDGELSRTDGWVLLADFAAVMGWFVLQGLCGKDGSIEAGSEESMLAHTVPLKNVIFWLIVGLMLLLARARMLA